MYIEFTGRISKTKRIRIEDIINFCAVELLTKKDWNGLEIEVKMKSLKGFCGFCDYVDNNVNPKSFLLEIAKDITGEELEKTVMHEMVHVKQYVKGELKERYKPNHHLIWHKEVFAAGEYEENVPWEVEAFKLENKLFERFNNVHNIKTN